MAYHYSERDLSGSYPPYEPNYPPRETRGYTLYPTGGKYSTTPPWHHTNSLQRQQMSITNDLLPLVTVRGTKKKILIHIEAR